MPSGRKRGGRPEGLWVSTTHFRPRKELLRMAASLSRNQAVTLQRPKATSLGILAFSSVQSLSNAWLCDPMDCSSLQVHHQLLKLAQIHVH